MAKNDERIRQLYQQCQEAYNNYVSIPNHAKSILQKGEESIDVPSNFYDSYNVPAELLFKELYEGVVTERNRFGFDNKLLQMMHKKQAFDIKTLKQSSKRTNQRLRKRYTVYFEAYYHQPHSSRPLFYKQLSIGGVTFEWCSKKLSLSCCIFMIIAIFGKLTMILIYSLTAIHNRMQPLYWLVDFWRLVELLETRAEIQ